MSNLTIALKFQTFKVRPLQSGLLLMEVFPCFRIWTPLGLVVDTQDVERTYNGHCSPHEVQALWLSWQVEHGCPAPAYLAIHSSYCFNPNRSSLSHAVSTGHDALLPVLPSSFYHVLRSSMQNTSQIYLYIQNKDWREDASSEFSWAVPPLKIPVGRK